MLLDIVTSDSRLLAVGERGHVLVSDDNGANWTQKVVPTKSTLTAVFAMGEQLWAVGHDAVILHSADNGETWQTQQFLPELERPLLDVFFFNPEQGIAIGAYGVFFRTQDGGQNWEREYHPTFLHPDDQAYVEELKVEDEEFYRQEMASILPHLNRVTADGQRLIVVGESGLVAYSEDFGQSWQRVETNYYGSFFGVAKLANGHVMAAGLRGSLYVSEDDMESWRRVETKTTATFNSVIPVNDSGAILVGNNGTVGYYQNGTMRLKKQKDGENVIDAIAAGQKAIAVSAVGFKSLPLN
ncbi:WD40/YVTN/BNR-like repeat-containing protein [Planctobacterium marinum]|uniref:WD40/YVTN/BNR-like repeat-containing protein n=1 Tax=Planctobacterium marinum TaxID=1631968 RepID=UPI001E3F7A29|nr:YCF48-related protein [Planctobacterium marinum]